MRPIEPGCLAVVIDSRTPVAGMTVLVIGRSDRLDWLVEPAEGNCFPFGRQAHAHDRQLLRIDGGEDEAESVTERHDEEIEA